MRQKPLTGGPVVIESRTVTQSPAGAHRPITGRLVIATHNPGKLREMRELLVPYGIEAVSAGELGLAEPEETGTSFRGQCRHQGAGRGSGIGLAGIRRRFRARRRCARWRRPASIPRAGPGRNKDFRHAMTTVEDKSRCARSAAPRAGQRTRAFRLRAVRRLARRARSKTSKPRSTARWCGRRAATRVSAMIRCSCPTGMPAPSAR